MLDVAALIPYKDTISAQSLSVKFFVSYEKCYFLNNSISLV